MFLGENPGELTQLYAIRISSNELRKLTDHNTNVTSYSTSANGEHVVYAAEKSASDLLMPDVIHYGFHIPENIDLPELIAGRVSNSGSDKCELFEKIEGQEIDRQLIVKGRLVIPSPRLFLSPDGEHLVVRTIVREIEPIWREYNDPVLEMVINWNLPKGSGIWIERYELLGMKDGSSRILIDAPIGYSHSELAWFADSQSVIVTGVHLPLLGVSDQKKRDARRAGTFVVAVTIRDGGIEEITDRSLELLGWEQHANLWKFKSELDKNKVNDSAEIVYYRRNVKGWQLVGDVSQAQAGPNIFVDQDLNAAPRLTAEDQKTNRKAVLLDLNPQLDAFLLGRVENIRWTDSAGQELKGGLYLPPGYEPGRKYPLVIQTHGYHPSEFWMDGPYTTAFAAQPLANRGIAVLQLGELAIGSAEEGDRNMRAIESAIDYLDQRGIIDRERVGLIGFSRTCYHVKYALAHSTFHFAAASVTDGIDAGYFQYFIFGNWVASTAAEFETLEGAPPFGEGLRVWLERAPGFSLDKVHTPLAIQAIGPSSLLGEWEWFSGLTHLGKPVDFVYIPTGSHVLEKPWDRMASQQRNVDWFVFWLKSEEDPDLAKCEQYQHWRKLREKQREK